MADADPFDAAIDAALKGGAAAPSQPAPAAAPASAPVDPFDSAIDDALAGKVAAPAAAKPVRPQIPLSEVPADIVNSGAQGAIYGTLAGIPSTLRTVRDLGARGQNWLIAHGAATLGMLPEGKTAHDLFNDLNGLDAQSAGRGEDAALGPTFEQAKALPDYLTGGEYQPKSVLGDYAKTVGEFAPFAGSAMLKAAVIPGITSETAGQLTKGTDWEPWARLGGAVVGGGAAGLAAPAVGAAVNKAKLAVEPMLNPERAAARELAATTPNIDAVDRLTSPGPMRPGEVPQYDPVAGVTPTTGAIANSPALRAAGQDAPELLQRERELRTGSDKDAISGLVAQDQANSAARTAALSNVQASGSPADVAARFRQLRDAADAQSAAAVNAATPVAEAADAAIGGRGDAQTTGYNIREPNTDARAAKKVHEKSFWNAIDRNLAVPSADIAGTANRVQGEITKSATPLSGEEARIFNVASSYGDQMPFGELSDLRSSITTATREATKAADTQAVRRLSILRQSIDDAMEGGLANKAAIDQVSVSRGAMAPEDTTAAKLATWNDWIGRNGGDAAGGAGQPSRAVAGERPSSGAFADFGATGTTQPASGQPRSPAGGAGVSQAPLPGSSQAVGGQKVYYPGGNVDVRYEVADAPSLVTSHNADFTKNAAYPQELQPRARESAPAQDQVNSMAARLQPEWLGRSPHVNSGAPIVGPDNVVESGNGRTMAIRKAYQTGRGGDYRAWLESQGYDTSGMQQPVLIARRVSGLAPEDREAFAHSAVQSTALRMGPGEQALSDARLISADDMSKLAPGASIASGDNSNFVRSFLSRLPASERGGLLDANGALNKSGAKRIEDAVTARAYGDNDLLQRVNSTDDNIRNIAGALVDAAGPWAKMRQAAAEGAIDPGHDITGDVMKATKAIMRARDAGRPISEVLNQGDMFGGEASNVAKALFTKADGSILSRQRIAENLRNYAEEASKNAAGPSMFGDTVLPADVLKASVAKGAKFDTLDALPEEQVASKAMQGERGPAFGMPAATPLDAEAYKAARQATRERVETFDKGAVGRILKPAPGGGYAVSDAGVINEIVPSGKNTDATKVAQYLNAGGSPEALADGIAYKIRKECSYPDGTLNPAKVQAYIRNPANREALAQLPPEYAQRFANAATTREAVESAQAAQIQAQKDFNQTALARVADLHDGADVVKTVGGIFGQQGAVAKMRELANAAKGDPAATEGLRRAIIEHMEQRLTSNLEGNAIKGSSYLGFVDKNGDVLRQVFTPAEMGRFHAIGESIDTAGRIHTTKGLTSSPGTAQDVAAHGPRIMGALMDELGPATAAAAAHMAGMGEIGSAAAWLGSKTLGRLKAAGLAKRDALINEAVTNPHAFRALMAKMPAKPDQGTAAALGHQLAVIASRASAADLSAQQGR